MGEPIEYRVSIRREGNCLWAEVDELPGCFAAGNDMEELAEALAEAISIYLAPTPAERRELKVCFAPREGAKPMPAKVQLAAA